MTDIRRPEVQLRRVGDQDLLRQRRRGRPEPDSIVVVPDSECQELSTAYEERALSVAELLDDAIVREAERPEPLERFFRRQSHFR